MARVLHIFAHPGQTTSRINAAMWQASETIEGISRLDLYRTYPRYTIRIDHEQERLEAHDTIVLQFPFFWYSSPALIKEWIDLTFAHGWAYGHDGDRLKGKTLVLAITAGGPPDSYTAEGYQNFPIRTFLTPFEQTANLCQMTFLAPYVLFGAIKAEDEIAPHTEGFVRLLTALRDDRLDMGAARAAETLSHSTIPLKEG